LPASTPHDSWAEAYDLACDEEFGELLGRITAATLGLVADLLPKPGAIVDFGAGTGRLAIPLAAAGHAVVAVEPSAAMLDVLAAKAGPRGPCRVACRMQDYRGEARFDLALCAFGVLSYVTTCDGLDAALAAARASLAPGGRILLDLPRAMLFASRRCETARILREVDLEPLGAGLFAYCERIELRDPSHVPSLRRYEDRFKIRAWSRGDLDRAAERVGLVVETDVSDRVPGSGADWLLLAPHDGISALPPRGSR